VKTIETIKWLPHRGLLCLIIFCRHTLFRGSYLQQNENVPDKSNTIIIGGPISTEFLSFLFCSFSSLAFFSLSQPAGLPRPRYNTQYKSHLCCCLPHADQVVLHVLHRLVQNLFRVLRRTHCEMAKVRERYHDSVEMTSELILQLPTGGSSRGRMKAWNSEGSPHRERQHTIWRRG
jgi:hypothetical protein